MQETEGL